MNSDPPEDCGRMAKCGHNQYWRTIYGNCMACRAERADADVQRLRAILARIMNALPPEGESFSEEDGPTCAKCGTHVNVRSGCDFSPGDMCDDCAQAFVGKVREAVDAVPEEYPHVQSVLNGSNCYGWGRHDMSALCTELRSMLGAQP